MDRGGHIVTKIVASPDGEFIDLSHYRRFRARQTGREVGTHFILGLAATEWETLLGPFTPTQASTVLERIRWFLTSDHDYTTIENLQADLGDDALGEGSGQGGGECPRCHSDQIAVRHYVGTNLVRGLPQEQEITTHQCLSCGNGWSD